MTGNETSSSKPEARVIPIRRGQPVPQPAPTEPVRDLTKYEHGRDDDGHDDYRHRMIVNVAAFIFVAALIGAGFWIADTMARMRKNQDCVLSGRRGCTPVEVTRDRW